MLRLSPARITVSPPGVDSRFTPAGERAPTPLVVAVGRLVRVKRFDLLMRSLADLQERMPDLKAVIIGEGEARGELEELRAELGAQDWLELPGRVDDDELVEWYRKAWVVASTSLREGWGMTLTEAAACGTPAVATAIAGHTDACPAGRGPPQPPLARRAGPGPLVYVGLGCSAVAGGSGRGDRAPALTITASARRRTMPIQM
jgi:glycosyltransferase involved in cell wall biosynthesis